MKKSSSSLALFGHFLLFFALASLRVMSVSQIKTSVGCQVDSEITEE